MQPKKKPVAAPTNNNNNNGGNVVENIKKLEQQREDRRRKMEEMKQAKLDRQAMNEAMGKNNIDAEFDLLIENHRKKVEQPLNHLASSVMNLCVCVRKRPLFEKEYVQMGEIDCVSASNPKVVVHECKYKVDGITKFIEDTDFKFDNVFSDAEGSDVVYHYQVKTLLPNLFKNGVVTCFAYGQTGSGKTFTMSQVTKVAVQELYELAGQNAGGAVTFYMSFFEIYGGKVMDLLNGKKKLQILEDKFQRIQVQGLEEKEARTAQDMLDIINFGHSVRTTHQTVANDTSSRSHAICCVAVKDASGQKTLGKLLLVDLAGSERAQDTQSNNRQRRIEGAEINKSLLALKECVRAIDMKSSHVPFRASKLTMVLRDSFLSSTDNGGSSKIVMIACISPGSASADHTLNTLRYAQRLKSNNSQVYANVGAIGYQQPQVQQPAPQMLKQQPSQGMLVPPTAAQQQPPKPQQQPPVPIQPSQVASERGKEEQKKRPQWQNVVPPAAKNPPQVVLSQAASNQQMSDKKELKQKKKEDWNYLKNTLRASAYEGQNGQGGFGQPGMGSGSGEQMIDPQELLTFHEKVDRIVEEEEELLNRHLQYLKEAAQLLTEEGELISNVQGVGSVEYDIDEYVGRMERIVARNIEIYGDLQKRLIKFKKHLKEEEEAHQNVRGTFYF